MSSDGAGGGGGGKKKPLPSATIVGLVPPTPHTPAEPPAQQQPPAQQPPAQQLPAQQPAQQPPAQQQPPQRRSNLPPPNRPPAGAPGHAAPGHATPGHAAPGHAAPSLETQFVPDQPTSPQARPSEPAYQQPSQPYAQQPSQPYAQQPSQPHAQHPSQPYAQQPSQPYAQQPDSLAHQLYAQQQQPVVGDPTVDPASMSFDSMPTSGGQFMAFLKISAKRAFRLRIEPNEVLPSERRTLETASPPIHDRNLQAFLAWRRSVLFLVACALIPLTVIGVIDALQSRKFTPIFLVRGAPAVAEGIFAWVCWSQMKKWANWRSQRRKLFWGWLLFMITPFIVFIYPLRTIFEELGGSSREKLLALGVDGAYRQAVMPFVFAMLAMLQLAPKAISLMPGLIRASLVIKLLFPGSSAPGWLMVMSAPLYALLAYVILIIPYQFTGSGWFIAGVLGVVVGQAVLAKAGFALAKPLEEGEALKHIKRVRTYYMIVMLVSAILIVVALGALVAQFNLRATDVVTAVLKFETNVLILTMIGADLVITNLDRARGYTAGRGHVEAETEVKIAAFVSLEAPSTPPPSGPAQ